MKNQVREVLAEVVEECARILASNKSRYRKFPIEFKQKVFKLHKMGVSVKELSQSLGVPVITIYSWLKMVPRQKVAGSVPPKRLRLKGSNFELPFSNFQRVILGRMTFKSGVYLEVPIEQLDLRLLSLLNGLGH
jgi:transposase-like protein